MSYSGKSQSADRKVHAGEYELNPGMTPAEILAKLLNGQVVLHPLTIPEGLTITQIADVAAHNRVSRIARSFSGLAKDRDFICVAWDEGGDAGRVSLSRHV